MAQTLHGPHPMHAPSPNAHVRWLLCASAAHCAQLLHAAATARIPLHGLQPSLAWPDDRAGIVLWALLPRPSATEAALELQWRTHMLRIPHAQRIHMLYGTATQQAQQLAPWIPSATTSSNRLVTMDCEECLDASSEHTLFQHLLQRK